jgi:ribose transport system substrate-binding protein
MGHPMPILIYDKPHLRQTRQIHRYLQKNAAAAPAHIIASIKLDISFAHDLLDCNPRSKILMGSVDHVTVRSERQMNLPALRHALLATTAACLLVVAGCRKESLRVAVIPQTTGVTLWEAEHAGAEFEAAATGVRVYWNAPTSEDDIQQQGALIERIIDEKYPAMILAPDQTIALMSPVRRALAKGIRTVVVASPLTLPAGRNLSYIVNDDEASGRMAAMRVGQILHGRGRIAVLGVTAESLSSLAVLHVFETTLEQHYPEIVIAERRFGTHNGTEEQQIADEVLSTDHRLDAIFTLSSSASDGTFAALESRGMGRRVKLVGFEQSAELANLVRLGKMDSLIAENTYEMGYRAMQLLALPPSSTPQNIKLEPTLLTIENIDSPGVQTLINMDWSHHF